MAAEVASAGFRVMGSDAHVVVVSGGVGADAAALVDRARQRLEELERRWTRFSPDSELSLLNQSGGQARRVSAETFALVERAVAGWRATHGRFDPTVLAAVVAAGYDRDFAAMPATPVPVPARPAPGCAGIVLSRQTCVVRLPLGTHVDAGGIGKGYAADLVVAELVQRGATSACVNVGGDLRVSGTSPDGGPWLVEVEDPWDGPSRATLALREGAVATTSRVRRAWSTDAGEAHHLVDPAWGEPARSGLACVTVVSGEAWRAEVLAKAAFIGGLHEGTRLVEREQAAALFVADDGRSHTAGDFAAFATSEAAA